MEHHPPALLESHLAGVHQELDLARVRKDRAVVAAQLGQGDAAAVKKAQAEVAELESNAESLTRALAASRANLLSEAHQRRCQRIRDDRDDHRRAARAAVAAAKKVDAALDLLAAGLVEAADFLAQADRLANATHRSVTPTAAQDSAFAPTAHGAIDHAVAIRMALILGSYSGPLRQMLTVTGIQIDTRKVTRVEAEVASAVGHCDGRLRASMRAAGVDVE